MYSSIILHTEFVIALMVSNEMLVVNYIIVLFLSSSDYIISMALSSSSHVFSAIFHFLLKPSSEVFISLIVFFNSRLSIYLVLFIICISLLRDSLFPVSVISILYHCHHIFL